MGKPAATAIRSGIPRAARVKNRQSRSAQRYSSMSVSCEPIRDRSGRRQAVAPLLTEATRRSINTQASHPGNGSPHGKKRTFFRRAIGWKSFPARRQAGTSSLQTAGNGQNGSDFASRSTGPLSTTESKPPQGSNQRKTKDYGKKAIDRTRKNGYGHADAQHSVCRIHSLHHPFLAHSLKESDVCGMPAGR